MYKELRDLRISLSAIETKLVEMAKREGISLSEMIEEFKGIVEEDCGEYVPRPRLLVCES